jgi:phytoene synthase
MPQISSAPDPATAADRAACQAALNEGSRTFFAASYLLPRRIRGDAGALYAFCRMADDAIDRGADGPAALKALRDRLDRIYAGVPLDIPADRAFAGVVQRHGIPRALPEALLEGFAWDNAGRRYETLSDLVDYAARVAGTVGAMMTLIMGCRGEATLARATELGVAMQLTNIARDIGEDARAGRLYLPLAWLRAEGIDPDAWLAAPRFEEGIRRCVARLLGVADDLYRRAEAGVADLPWPCRAGILAARTLYAEIGREVERRGHNSVSGRAVVPAWRKVRLASGLPLRVLAPRRSGARLPTLAETRFLVEAAATHPPQPRVAPLPAWWRLDQQFVFVIDLIERLEHRDRKPAVRVEAKAPPA